MVDPTNKDAKHIKDRTTDADGHLKYVKENEQGKVNQLDVWNKKDEQNTGMCV